MGAQANLERIGEPSEGEATPELHLVRERRAVRESAGGGPALSRWIAAGILGGAVVIYGMLGVLVYLAM